jgi:hypothetical protein
MKRDFITYYNNEAVVGMLTLKELTDHKDRLDLAKKNNILNFTHYEMRDSGMGMMNDALNFNWYNLDGNKIKSLVQ